MKNKQNRILLGIDLEEFDVPEEYGQQVKLQTKLNVTLHGLIPLYDLLHKHDIKATFFTTAFWASHFPEWIKELAKKHEIASHTYYHNSFKIEDLFTSRKLLQQISGQQVSGLRMPRMKNLDLSIIAEAGYLYDSSINPTWLPGRYNNLGKPRKIFKKENVWELPASVSPVLRIPIFWLSFKNLPFEFYKMLCKTVLKKDGYIVFYVHPWEFACLSSYKMPFYLKRRDGKQLLERLNLLLGFLGDKGEFITHGEMLEIYSANFSPCYQ